jgi:hypothetical protein
MNILNKIQKRIDESRKASTVVNIFNTTNNSDISTQDSHSDEDCDYIIAGKIYDIQRLSTNQECGPQKKFWEDLKIETVCQETVEFKDQSKNTKTVIVSDNLSSTKKTDQVFKNEVHTHNAANSNVKSVLNKNNVIKMQEISTICSKSNELSSNEKRHEDTGESQSVNNCTLSISAVEAKTSSNLKETKNNVVSKNQSKDQSNAPIKKIGLNKQKKREKYHQKYKYLNNKNTKCKDYKNSKVSDDKNNLRTHNLYDCKTNSNKYEDHKNSGNFKGKVKSLKVSDYFVHKNLNEKS